MTSEPDKKPVTGELRDQLSSSEAKFDAARTKDTQPVFHIDSDESTSTFLYQVIAIPFAFATCDIPLFRDEVPYVANKVYPHPPPWI